MSEHRATIHWQRGQSNFEYEKYDRTHLVKYEGGLSIKATAALEFFGKKELVNPEQAFAGAIASCHMLTFLAIASKSGYVVDDYHDEAVALLEKNPQGQYAVTKIRLKPHAQFSGEKIPNAERIKKLHEKAHANCMIANSVKSEIIIEAVLSP